MYLERGLLLTAETKMSKRAFDKIQTGIDSAKAYLDGKADKMAYRVHELKTNGEIDVESVPARLREGGRSTRGKLGMRGGFKPNRTRR